MLHLETVESSTLELLIRLQGLNSLKETRLVGGTALSLQYGHRISVDLDLFVHSTSFNFLDVIAEINNLRLQMEIRKQSPNILISMIENVKVDIVNYPYLSYYSTKFNDGSLLMVLRSLTFFDDAETDLSPRILDKDINWKSVKKTLLQEVKRLS